MTKNTEHVIHIHSKQVIGNKPKLPTQDKLAEGEIAVNYGENVETLSIKNESGTVVTFSSDNYYTEQKLGSAFTGSNSATTVTDILNSLEVGEEVEVNSGDTPTGNTIELWIDESIEPVTVEVYTKAETNSLLAEKADEATTLNGYGITDAYTKTEVDTMMTTATEQSTINATDYVVLKDTDGVNRKISKANMMSVVKDALADLLKSNDLGTSVTNVPALNASAFGSATVDNLASVLGVWKNFGRLNSGNANTILSDNLYFTEMNGSGMSNLPTNDLFYHVLTMPSTDSSYATQLAITMNGTTTKAYVRNMDSNNWGSWKEV